MKLKDEFLKEKNWI